MKRSLILRIVAPIALLVTTFGIVPGIASARVPALSISFSASKVEVHQGTTITLCDHQTKNKTVLALDEAFGTKSVWRTIYDASVTPRLNCVVHAIKEASLGKYSFRLQLLRGGQVVLRTSPLSLEVFGSISILELQNSVGLGCETGIGGIDNPASLSIGGRLYTDFCGLGEEQ